MAQYFSLIKQYLLVVCILLLSACGGGGGSNVQPTENPVSTPKIVAVIDSGISTSHSAFASVTFSQNSGIMVGSAISATQPLDDYSGHGTGVASFVSGYSAQYAIDHDIDNGLKEIMGIGLVDHTNPEAVSASINLNQMAGLESINAAIDHAVSHNADIINMSLGFSGLSSDLDLCTGSTNCDSYFAAVAAGKIMVVAAGNEPTDSPHFPANIARFDAALGQGIAVGALNEAGDDIASFSARAGDSKDFFLLAPGSALPGATVDGSTVSEDGVITKGSNAIEDTWYGTSFAAPIVSAAAATVWAEHSYLAASQVVNILLHSADDMGVAGVDEIYGHGKLNVTNALAAQGNTFGFVLPNSHSVFDSGFTLGSSLVSAGGSQNSITNALKDSNVLKQAIFLDDYKRAYGIDLTQIIETSSDEFKSRWHYQMAKVTALESMSIGKLSLQSQALVDSGNLDDVALRFNYQLSAKLDFTVDKGLLWRDKLLANNTLLSSVLDEKDLGQSSYLQLMPTADLQLYMGQANAELDHNDYWFYGGKYQLTKANELGLGGLQVSESDNQVLANEFSGAFGLSDNYQMHYINGYWRAQLNKQQGFLFNYLYGFGDDVSGDGLVANISDITMSGGEALYYLTGKDYRLLFGFESPLAIDKGHMDLRVATGVSSAGEVMYSNERLSLRGQRQFNVVSQYQVSLTEDKSLKLTTAMDVNKLAQNQLVSISYQWRF